MYECKICGKADFEKITQLTTHIQFHHKDYTSQCYYDKFLKRTGDGICPTCGGPTPFRGLIKGYQKFCSNKCVWQDPEVKAKRAESISNLTDEQVREWRQKNIESHKNDDGKCISYEELGFKFIHKSNPSYAYIVKHKRHSRFEFQKHKLVAEGADPNKSEHEIMKERKCPRIYDCGTLKYEWNRS